MAVQDCLALQRKTPQWSSDVSLHPKRDTEESRKVDQAGKFSPTYFSDQTKTAKPSVLALPKVRSYLLGGSPVTQQEKCQPVSSAKHSIGWDSNDLAASAMPDWLQWELNVDSHSQIPRSWATHTG